MSFSIKANRERAEAIRPRLEEAYPDARCSLDYATPLDLLVATILAAQCTDERVNIVTKTLFRRYRTPKDYLAAPRDQLEADVRTCGFFRQKSKSIVNACRRILEVYNGEVPGTMEELITLDGVGRKTANVLLGECFGTPGIIVDTHAGRISRRLRFTRHEDPGKVEQDLMRILPRESWTQFSHCLVFHGRRTCTARSPKCDLCPIHDWCPYPSSRKEAG
jgi:endonuclease-3